MKYVYRAQKNSKRQSYPVLILFFALLFGFTILNFFWPKRQISELENRMTCLHFAANSHRTIQMAIFMPVEWSLK